MKEELICLARKAIESEFNGISFEPEESIKNKFNEKKACFVTLTLNKDLRGCIGSLIARKELIKEVIENAINAAFNDSRFLPLTREEFKNTKIEISILTEPKSIRYDSLDELKKKIKDKGVVISYGYNSATYLPQVWDDLINEEDFLSSLCVKAGLPEDFWKTENLDVSIYEVEKIVEK